MKKFGVPHLLGCLLALTSIGTLAAQGTVPAATGAAVAAPAQRSGLAVPKGARVRPDGGYAIAIKSPGRNGALEATYFDPNRLPFAKAQAMREGTALRVVRELQAGGHAGSTYDLI